MDHIEAFWNASLDELKQGYIKETKHVVCLLCGKKTEKGLIYQDDGLFMDAERFIIHHIEKDHRSVFDYLIQLDKKRTGLTDHQNRLLRLFYQGKSDTEIQKELGIGSSSTVRNHRFVLKEKERQAKIFLVLMELLREKNRSSQDFIDFHQTATMIDDRYNIIEEERNTILTKFFPEGINGALKSFPQKEKQRLVVLQVIARRFEHGKIYDEKQVNQLLSEVYDDYAILRRYLVEYGFMDRKSDGSQYWLK